MRLAPYRAWHLTLAVALTIPLAACVAPPSASPVAHEVTSASTAKAASPTGTVKVDVSQLFNSGPAGKRHTLGYGLAADAVTHVRLVVKYPGMGMFDLEESEGSEGSEGSADPVLGTVPLNTSSGVNTIIECTVPAGPNRVFIVEALDSSGNVLMRMRSAANVAPDSLVKIKVNFLRDAVARVIECWIDDPFLYMGEIGGSLGFLDDAALIDALTTYVKTMTGFDENTNSTTGAAPQYVDAAFIAEEVARADSITWLATPNMSDKEYLLESTSAVEHISIEDMLSTLESPPTIGDSNNWRLTLIAPIGGVWNLHRDLAVETYQEYADGPEKNGFRIEGMPAGLYTLILKNTASSETYFFNANHRYGWTEVLTPTSLATEATP